MSEIIFTVEGSGEFPLDMLRHSQAYPYDPASAENMKNTRVKKRKVPLGSSNPACIIPARWESFGWRFLGKAFFPDFAGAYADGFIDEKGVPTTRGLLAQSASKEEREQLVQTSNNEEENDDGR